MIFNIGRHSINLDGRYEKNTHLTRSINVVGLRGPVSKNNYQSYQANIRASNRNGVMKGNIGGRDTKGTQYSGRFGNLGWRGGKQNTKSVNVGIQTSKYGVGLNEMLKKQIHIM